MTQYPQQPNNPYQPQPYGASQQPMGVPPKKDNTLWYVLGGIGALILLCCCGVLVWFFWIANAAKEGIESYSSSNEVETTVTEGVSFTHNDFSVRSGWRVDTDSVGSTPEALTVVNEGSSADSFFFTVNFYKGGSEVGDSTCSTSTVQPGVSGSATCTSTIADVTGYDKITVTNW